MTEDQARAQANREMVLDWIDALRRRRVDAIAGRFHPEVVWVDVGGDHACSGREQVLDWLRAAPAQPPEVDALELLANRDHVVLGVQKTALTTSSPGCFCTANSSRYSPCATDRSCTYETTLIAPRRSPPPGLAGYRWR